MNLLSTLLSNPGSFNPASPPIVPTRPGTYFPSTNLGDDSAFLSAVSQALDTNIGSEYGPQVMTALYNCDLASLNNEERGAILQAVNSLNSGNLSIRQRDDLANTIVAMIGTYSGNQGPGLAPITVTSTSMPFTHGAGAPGTTFVAPAPSAPATPAPASPSAPATPSVPTPAGPGLPTFAAPGPFVIAAPAPAPAAPSAPATPAAPMPVGSGQTLSNGLFVSNASLASSEQFGGLVQQTLRQSGILPLSSPYSEIEIAAALFMRLDTSTLSPQQRYALLEQITRAVEDNNVSNDELNSIVAAAGPQPWMINPSTI